MAEPARPAPPAGALALCAADTLEDGGAAHLFDVRLWGEPARAFVMRFDGRFVAYLNRCAHVPTEMDWDRPGHFLDAERRYIQCPVHGAVYEPGNGRCIEGPCRGEHLIAVDVIERGGQVYWYPSPDVQPPPDHGAA